MCVVDITRGSKFPQNDILVGIDSMNAKSNTINHITDYAFANHNVYLDYDLLDQGLNMDYFSLKQFMKKNYSLSIDNDLKIILFLQLLKYKKIFAYTS